jgi:hypothetical protein
VSTSDRSTAVVRRDSVTWPRSSPRASRRARPVPPG